MIEDFDTTALGFDEMLRLNGAGVCASCGPLRATGELGLLDQAPRNVPGEDAFTGRFCFRVGAGATFSFGPPRDFHEAWLEHDSFEDVPLAMLSVRRVDGELLLVYQLPD